MGIGGIVVLILFLAIAGTILYQERPFSRTTLVEDGFPRIPSGGVVLERAPQIVERQTPAWQSEIGRKFIAEGWTPAGDHSYAAGQFFWAHILIAPDRKTALLFVNWVEGLDQGKRITTNLELYSFDDRGSFLLTACAQDGAARLLTGANRPSEKQLSLHLKAVFAESSVKPILDEHRKRMAENEASGAAFLELDPANVLPLLSKAFTG